LGDFVVEGFCAQITSGGFAEHAAFSCPEQAGFIVENERINQDGVGVSRDDAIGASLKVLGGLIDLRQSAVAQLLFDLFDNGLEFFG